MGRARKTIRRIIVILLILALIGGGGYYGIGYLRKSNEKEVMVVEVASIMQEDSYYWYDSESSLTGEIVTNVTQNVQIDKDVIIDQLLVEQGDEVKTGDKLMTFDMTLVDMELNIARLKRQKTEQDLNKALWRLDNLQRGGPIQIDDSADDDSGFTASSGDFSGTVVAAAFPVLLAAELISGGDDTGDGGGYEELTGDLSGGDYLPPTQTFVDPANPEPGEDGSGEDGSGDDGLVSGDDEPDGPDEENPDEEPFEPVQGPTPTPIAADPALLDGLIDGAPPFYLELDYETEPFVGSGTEDDPFIFLCSSARGYIIVKGSFFNKMAGFNDDGTVLLKEGGYWYVLEFHERDTIADFTNRTGSSIGYYYINGGLLERPVNPFAEAEFTVANAEQYPADSGEEEIPDDDYGGGGGDYGDQGATMTRAEAIKLQENKIRSLRLTLKEEDVSITQLERKSSMQELFSKIDGVVAYVGDPVEGTSGMESFLRITSAEGYYIRGTVNEMMLDQIDVGTRLTCMTDMGEEFEAEVISIAEYPSSSGSMYGWGGSNPNASSYAFSANICPEYDYVNVNSETWLMSITLPASQEEQDDGITIPKAFVRSENGVSFVYKEKKGVLKKQAVKVSKTDAYGYTITISQGITLDDYLAFPYSSDAADGVKTVRGTLEDLYNGTMPYGG